MSASNATASDSIAATVREPLLTKSAASHGDECLSSDSESPLASRRDFLKVGSVVAGRLSYPRPRRSEWIQPLKSPRIRLR